MIYINYYSKKKEKYILTFEANLSGKTISLHSAKRPNNEDFVYLGGHMLQDALDFLEMDRDTYRKQLMKAKMRLSQEVLKFTDNENTSS